MSTPRLALDTLAAGQASAEVLHNEALYTLDALVNCHVLSRSLTTPPGSPDVGDTYLPAHHQWPITAVNTGTKQFTVSGNYAALLSALQRLEIRDSTGNDGTYVIASATYSAPNTLIVVQETVPSATADGDIYFLEGVWNRTSAGVVPVDTIAYYTSGGWRFRSPLPGWRAWVEDEIISLTRDTIGWDVDPSGCFSRRLVVDIDEGGGTTTFLLGAPRLTNGTGSGSASESPSSTYGLNRIGIVQFSTGSTSTGRSGWGFATPPLLLGQGTVVIEQVVRLDTLSDGSNTYTLAVGFMGDPTVTNASNRVQFTYTHGTLSGRWQCETSAGGSASTADSGITVVAGTWYNLKIVINAAATSAAFYINNVLAATITTNIPNVSGRPVGPGLGIFKSVGTTTRGVHYDGSSLRVERLLLPSP